MHYKRGAIAGAATAAMMILGYGYTTAPQQAVPKLAYINSAVIIEQTPGAAEAQETFEREMARWRAEVQVLADSLQQMLTQYEQQQVMLAPETRQQRQQAILQKRMEYNQRVEELQNAAQTRQAELVQPIYDRITTVLAQLRDEQSYSMIFDVAGGGTLVAADTALDITDEVIARLQAEAAAEQPSNPN